jgi:hypothetical protein
MDPDSIKADVGTASTRPTRKLRSTARQKRSK